MGGQGVILLDPGVDQSLHLLHLLWLHAPRQVEVKAQPLCLQITQQQLGKALRKKERTREETYSHNEILCMVQAWTKPEQLRICGTNKKENKGEDQSTSLGH